MRISAHEDSPDFNMMYAYATVTLDGVAIRGVIDADEEAGELTVYLFGEDGRVLVEGDEAVTGTVHGLVKISFPTIQ